MASIFVAQALLVWRHGGKAFSARLIIVVALFESGILAIRCVTALTEPVGLGLFDASSTQTVYLVANSFTMLTFTVGLVLMATDRLRAELEQLATHDPLTNALTRRALIDACEQELERCRRHDREMSLLLLDLDHFKLINDTHGHLAGDRVLRDLVTRISALLRSPDQLGRFGGEEFVVLLPETGLDEALVVAERIRKEAALAKDLPTCTVSIGVATHRPDDALVDALLARADAALYKAKALGRNRVATA
jgi:diguanylate cyclase (GGDEF)-like protein